MSNIPYPEAGETQARGGEQPTQWAAVAALQKRLDEEVAAHQKLRADVLRVAKEKKREREWCTVVNQMLEDIGIPFPAAVWEADVVVRFHVKAEIAPSSGEEHPGSDWLWDSMYVSAEGQSVNVYFDDSNRNVEITDLETEIENFEQVYDD